MNTDSMGQVLLVGAGGCVGSMTRFLVTGAMQRLAPLSTFPFGTLAVNLLGCLAIGFLGGLMESRQLLGPGQRAFLLVGVLGGFTTFSAFAFDTLGMIQDGRHVGVLLNIIAQVALGLMLVVAGHAAGMASS